jgi:hypothetical protein
MRIIIDPKRNVLVEEADHTTLFRTIENGIMALSPVRYSQAKKTASVPPDPQNRPMILALFHG